MSAFYLSNILIFAVLLYSHCVHSYQNEIGSGDEDLPDDKVPPARWDNHRTSNPGWNQPEDRNRPGSDNGWQGRGRPSDNDWEIDEVGSGGDGEIVRTYPGVEQNVPPRPSPGPDDDLIGGDGIIVDNENPDEIVQLCTENYCLNNGVCRAVHQSQAVYCICSHGFTGKRCENRDIIIGPEPEDIDVGDEDIDVGEAKREKSHIMEVITNPIALAVFAVAGLLFIALIVMLLVICCRCIRKKDEGSYALDEALRNNKVEYTKVPNTSQEFYA